MAPSLPRLITHTRLSLVLTLLALSVACGDTTQGSITPTEGEWLGEQVGFHLENDALTDWWLQGMYCESQGAPACLAVPEGIPEASTLLQDGAFTITFGELTLEGSFDTTERASGTWSMNAPGCCQASGQWTASMVEALPPPEPASEEPTPPGGSLRPRGAVPTAAGLELLSRSELCARWQSDRAVLNEPVWSREGGECAPGDIDEAGRERVLLQVNLYRALAGLKAVALAPEYNELAQACSALMEANGAIEHVPPETWECYSEAGARGAGESNLATTPAVRAVNLYMGDMGNDQTMGHRRWILQQGLGPFGVGSTNNYSCLHVLKSESKDDVLWTAWPPPGYFPMDAASTLEPVGWTFHSHTHSALDTATVTVSEGGSELPVTSWPLAGGYGGSEAIAFRPEGWSPQAESSYTVEIGGVSPPVTYTVEFVGCVAQ